MDTISVSEWEFIWFFIISGKVSAGEYQDAKSILGTQEPSETIRMDAWRVPKLTVPGVEVGKETSVLSLSVIAGSGVIAQHAFFF